MKYFYYGMKGWDGDWVLVVILFGGLCGLYLFY